MNLLMLWEQFGRAVSDETGASDSLIHVHAGMAILLLARVATRRSLASWTPFLVVLVFAIANELADRWFYNRWRVEDTALDLLNTLFWPFVLMVGLRLRRARDSRAARR